MSFNFSAASIFLFCSSAFCGWLAAYALMQRRSAFSRNFVALMLFSALYALGYGLELASPDLALIKAALRLQYAGIPFLPLAWVGLAWSYLDSRGLPRVWWRTLLALSTLIFLIHQSNDLHHLYYAELAFSRHGDLSITHTSKGPAYWLTIAYLNIGFGAGVLLFFRAWRQSKAIYHHQARCLLIGSSFPWLCHLAYQFGLSPGQIDLGPFGLAASGLLFAIASFRHGILDVLPMARDMVFDGIAEGVIVIDDQGRVVDFNRAANGFFPELGHHSIGLTRNELEDASPLSRILATPGPFECPLTFDGQTRHLEIRRYRMRDRGGRAVGNALLIEDITEKKALIEQLHQTAATDELTGVFNRRHLMALSQRAVQLAQRHQSRLSVIIVDIDHFKAVNDIQGHLAGDAQLKKIASLFRARLRATDILGRYGGDEFIITLAETDAQQAQELAHKLNQSCREECGTTLSLGVAELQAPMLDFNALLGKADEALYRAKASGRNQVAIHVPATSVELDP
ncbi:MAG: diguanylate cyclase with sensor [Proteobacteria bacterium]|nr:diguanylate cyclase with sensor [Pseudomonadota bacterium]